MGGSEAIGIAGVRNGSTTGCELPGMLVGEAQPDGNENLDAIRA